VLPFAPKSYWQNHVGGWFAYPLLNPRSGGVANQKKAATLGGFKDNA
jgi:hypothetical protein